MIKISIVITTHKREKLLKRTLESISNCTVPPCPANIIVIENGYRGSAENICKTVNIDIPMHYCYLEKPGTSNARGHSLSLVANDTFVIFFDDDVRVDKDILQAYYLAFEEFGSGYFYGGPIHPDYEKEPDIEFINLFPPSITGFVPFSERTITKKPIFLGANWAAFSSDILSAGNFNDKFGPGGSMQATGHEYDIQRRLLDQGKVGVYLPNAAVWHFIPKSNVCFKWLKNRCYKSGLSNGYRYRKKEEKGYLFGIPRWLIRKITVDFLIMLFQSLFQKRRYNYYEKSLNFHRSLGMVSFFLKNR